MSRKVLVTGDKGYIGAVLTDLLLSKGYDVTGLDTNFYKKRLSTDIKSKKYKSINKDIRDISQTDLQGFDSVIHLAALSNDPIGELNPKLTQDINFKSTANLAMLAKKAGIRRFIFSSSCSIYGKTKEEKVSEESKINPLTEYAKTKLLSENYLKKISDNDFCVGIMRNSTVYGYSPKFRDDLVVNNFIVNGLATGKIVLLSDGTPWRPLIDVRDLSQAFLEFLLVDVEKINGEIFNVGFNDGNYQIREVLEIVKKYLKNCDVELANKTVKDSRSYRVDFDKFSKTFPSFKKKWNMDKSVKDLIKNLEHHYTKRDLMTGTYTRLAVLKKLQQEKKINNNLYWN